MKIESEVVKNEIDIEIRPLISNQNRNDEVNKFIALAFLKKEEEELTFKRKTSNIVLKSRSA